jgi:hypothetical protein
MMCRLLRFLGRERENGAIRDTASLGGRSCDEVNLPDEVCRGGNGVAHAAGSARWMANERSTN